MSANREATSSYRKAAEWMSQFKYTIDRIAEPMFNTPIKKVKNKKKNAVKRDVEAVVAE